ncbi:MAG: SOS response-associated peptidase family protein [Alphaproteobacteria bacterium]|nr:SOS response-associated peptidase family protein [Alphaproteobacteria bacterium]
MASWRSVVAFSRPLTGQPAGDERVTYRPMMPLPVIVFDPDTKQRRVLQMRWGLPAANNALTPKHIHARSETIDSTQAFAPLFHGKQRGIVVMNTFNEGLDLPNGRTEQWTIDPGDGIPRGFAFLWQRYEIEGQPLLACVMATVPASKLIQPVTDRMPAILEDADWAAWLGETDAPPEQVKATLRTMEGVNWTMEREARPVKANTAPPAEEPTLF